MTLFLELPSATRLRGGETAPALAGATLLGVA